MDAPEGYRPIDTAPRDGTPVQLWAEDADVNGAVMKWNPTGRNAVFQPDVDGIWELLGGGMTWSEARGFGPTHWRPLQ